MIVSARTRPIAWSRGHPNVVSASRFHSVIRPPLSIPTTASLAVSMMLLNLRSLSARAAWARWSSETSAVKIWHIARPKQLDRYATVIELKLAAAPVVVGE